MKIRMPRNELVIMAIGTGVVVNSVVLAIKTHREESAKREEIRRQARLDLEAIELAKEVVQERMEDVEYCRKGIEHVYDNWKNEVAFQKIVVREDI